MTAGNTRLDRRSFVKGAAMASALVAAGLAGSPLALAEEAAEEGAEGDAAEETVEIDYREVDVKELAANGANIAHATTYGVYEMEGDALDSAIKCDLYYDLDEEDVVYVEFEEALLPFSPAGGATGWGLLDEETVAELAPAAIVLADGTAYPMYFQIGDVLWTGAATDDGSIEYTADIDGTETEFVAYVADAEGGAWYHDAMADGAQILDADGNAVADVEIGTKASIDHGVGFWPSPLTFPGNIQLLENYVDDYGTGYDYAPDGSDIVKNDDGVWVVCDTATGATLAGAPNYLNLMKEAVEAIEAGDYELVGAQAENEDKAATDEAAADDKAAEDADAVEDEAAAEASEDEKDNA